MASPWLYFAFVFCWSWSFWIIAAWLGVNMSSGLGAGLKVLGLLGPAIGGIGLTYLTRGKEGWRDYWVRLVDVRGVSPRWYLVIFLFVPSIMALSILLDVATGSVKTLPLLHERIRPLLLEPLSALPYLFGVLINGPLFEELGWRGYVLDRLQERWSAVVSSVVLGVLWSIWHIPLFFLSGQVHEGHGAFSLWFWLFLALVIPTSVVFTWIFNNTGRSTFGAVLFHFIANLTYGCANVTDGTNFYSCLLWFVFAVAIILMFGPSKLVREHP